MKKINKTLIAVGIVSIISTAYAETFNIQVSTKVNANYNFTDEHGGKIERVELDHNIATGLQTKEQLVKIWSNDKVNAVHARLAEDLKSINAVTNSGIELSVALGGVTLTPTSGLNIEPKDLTSDNQHSAVRTLKIAPQNAGEILDGGDYTGNLIIILEKATGGTA